MGLCVHYKVTVRGAGFFVSFLVDVVCLLPKIIIPIARIPYNLRCLSSNFILVWWIIVGINWTHYLLITNMIFWSFKCQVWDRNCCGDCKQPQYFTNLLVAFICVLLFNSGWILTGLVQIYIECWKYLDNQLIVMLCINDKTRRYELACCSWYMLDWFDIWAAIPRAWPVM